MALPPPDFTEIDVLAVRAFIAGTASSDQQRTAANVILRKLCRVFDSPYVSQGGDRDTFVMIGRHQVGVMITSTQTPQTLERAQADDLRKLNLPPPTKRQRPS